MKDARVSKRGMMYRKLWRAHSTIYICMCVCCGIFNRCNANGKKMVSKKNSHWNLNEPKITQHLPHFFLNFRWTNSKFELTGHSTWTFFFFSYAYQHIANTLFIKGSLYTVFIFKSVFLRSTFRVIKCFFSAFNLPLNPILFQL